MQLDPLVHFVFLLIEIVVRLVEDVEDPWRLDAWLCSMVGERGEEEKGLAEEDNRRKKKKDDKT